MKKLPIGIQTFEKLVKENCVYVDKTEHMYNFIKRNSYYFMSRPRRFGKSLLISTLKEIFLGNKSLFGSLFIGKSDYDWVSYPVIHLDFSSIAHRTSHDLQVGIMYRLGSIAKQYSIEIPQGPTPEDVLYYLVTELARQRGKVVILIDEYDYPILTHLHNLTVAREQQAILRSLYTIIKSLDTHLHFVFLTGVSKFSRTSIFSGLNNLKDMSNTPEGATLLGYTQEELEHYFDEHIQHIAEKQKVSKQEIIANMKQWYNGYRFSQDPTTVYNPFSVLLYVDSGLFENYWYETGTPSFLVNIVRDKYQSVEKIVMGQLGITNLGTFNIENIPLVTLLFQTGYLTIKDYSQTNHEYKLGFPNREVKVSFERHLLSLFTHVDEPDVDTYVIGIRDTLETNNIPEFCDLLRSLFAHIPYNLHIHQEKFYHSLFQFMGTMLGLTITSEVATDKGRIDLTITTKKYVYVFEFKFNQTASKALKQIEAKK